MPYYVSTLMKGDPGNPFGLTEESQGLISESSVKLLH